MQLAVSTQTCNEACWEAREDACRCMCNGRNHGIYRHGGERPGRFSHKNGRPYKVVAIVATWMESRHVAHELVWPDGYNTPHGRCLPSRAIDQHATGGMLKWPEVKAFIDLHGDAYLVWQTCAADGTAS